MTIPLLINHLWQASCFALLAGLLAFVLRKNSPKVRYWVWLSASLKFLIPFALLVSVGSVVPHPAQHPVSVAAPIFPNALVQIAEPFSPALKATVPAHAPLDWAPVAIRVVWALGFLAITLARCRSWLRVRTALRAGMLIELSIPVKALITPGAEEPGIVGFLRPVLVLPAQLLEHLNPRQLGAILTHELCHVRRRDNLFAAVHMVVEAIFWFDPLVWWIGSRMVEERELACDEEVLRMGCEPSDYVEGILKVCRFYTESPLPCISGATGADVKKRLHAILAGSVAHELSAAKKTALATIGLAALAAPVLIGVMNAPAIRAQEAPATTSKESRRTFEVASVKLADEHITPYLAGGPGSTDPGHLVFRGIGMALLLRRAFNVDRYQMAVPSGLPGNRYDIEARIPSGTDEAQFDEMLRNLLVDRFDMKMHHETHDLPGYEMVVAKGRLRMKPAETAKSGTPDNPPGTPLALIKDSGGENRLAFGRKARLVIRLSDGRTRLSARLQSMADIVDICSHELQRPVTDHTGLSGLYDFDVDFARVPDEPVEARAADATDYIAPPFVTAFQAQLGLRLESRKVPVDVIVIDHVRAMPTSN